MPSKLEVEIEWDSDSSLPRLVDSAGRDVTLLVVDDVRAVPGLTSQAGLGGPPVASELRSSSSRSIRSAAAAATATADFFFAEGGRPLALGDAAG